MTRWQAHALTALLTLALQLALQAAFFPWSALAGSARLNNIDAPFHLYQMETAADLCEEGQVLGYDTRFAAGHLGGVTFNASAKLPALLYCLAPAGTGAEQVYKAVSFWSGVLAPLGVVLACILLSLGPGVTAVAALLAVLSWWTGPLRWYHTAGMVSFVSVAFAVPAFVAAFVRATEHPTALRLLGLGLAAALGVLVHPLFAVAAVLLGAPWVAVASRWPREGLVRLAAAVAVAALMVLLSWPWLIPSLTAPGLASTLSPYQRVVDPWLFLREMAGAAPTAAGGSRLFGALLLASLVALAWTPRGPLRRTLLGTALGAVVLMAWASLGAMSERIALLQPNRFSAVAWLVLTLPAAVGFVALGNKAAAARGLGRSVAVVLGLACALPLAYSAREGGLEALAPPGQPRYGVQPPEVRSSGAVEEATLRFLQEQTDPSGRVLFENSLGRVHDGGHIAGMLAWRSGRELIGGPYPFAGVANAWDGVAFGQDLARAAPPALAAWLDAYNVRWMLCHSATCRQAMAALAGVQQVGAWGPVTAFARAGSPGFVAEGQARVSARCTNRVEFEDVQGDRVTLRYQWVPGLQAVPGGTVQPVTLHPDAPPFVAVIDPPARFALRWGPGPGVACGLRAGAAR